MAAREERLGPPTQQDRDALAPEWRRLGRAATIVATLTSPATFVVLYVVNDLPLWLSIALTLFMIAAFRGAVDIICPPADPAAVDVQRDARAGRRGRAVPAPALVLADDVPAAVHLACSSSCSRCSCGSSSSMFLGIDAGLFNSLGSSATRSIRRRASASR